MRILPLFIAALVAVPALAQSPEQAAVPSPGEIVAVAPASEWVRIAPDDLLVMDLDASHDGKARRVVIQLMPAPFSQPWVANIRTLAKAKWWDGLAIVRAQDNYVVQWGDPDGEDAAKARALPSHLEPTDETGYQTTFGGDSELPGKVMGFLQPNAESRAGDAVTGAIKAAVAGTADLKQPFDSYAMFAGVADGWPLGTDGYGAVWPTHCYGMVGVGRNNSPDAGTGAELYTVIGHAPRHLDRNIALVGRVIEGIEHLSTLPRGTGPLGFYEKPEERTGITSIRVGTEVGGLSAYEYLSTDGEAFARYADARANRRDPFFIVPAGGADVCNIPVPVRRAP